MTEALLKEFEPYIEQWILIPGDGGAFEVAVDGNLIYSKFRTGRHPEIGELRTKLKQAIG